jgi:transmembrane sensor
MDELHSYLDIAELAGKFLKGEITQQERIILETWIAQGDQNKAIWENLTRQEYLEQQLESWEDQNTKAAWKELLPAIRSVPSIDPYSDNRIPGIPKMPVIKRYTRYVAAALVFILAGSSVYMAYRGIRGSEVIAVRKVASVTPLNSIPPGSHSAQLVLSSGKVIGLGTAGPKKIHEADGTAVENDRNVLKYASVGVNLKDETCFNTVITPRGGEYQLVLSDGTKVWLNAASSIRYPVCFTGRERRVTIVGEAYLEVAKDADRPFVVTTRQSDITVLGTAFNVKAYPDEPADKTSLVEGLVKVSTLGATAGSGNAAAGSGNATTGSSNAAAGSRNTGSANAGSRTVLLHPGVQAVVEGGGDITVSNANLEEALAWKNGLFVFQSESLESIARKLSRWYNVDVVFQDNDLRRIRFTGRLRRYDDMNVLLKMIAATSRATFNQQGLQVIVGAQ